MFDTKKIFALLLLWTLLSINCKGAVITGTEEDDDLEGTTEDDEIYGLGGDDIIWGKRGRDLIDGGPGTDTARYEDIDGQGITIRMDGSPGTMGEATGDRLVDIENIEGTEGTDVVVGNGEDNEIWGRGGNDNLEGQAGDDVLHGGEGDDTLRGGPGGDVIDGGPGIDKAIYSGSSVGVNVSLLDATANKGGEAEGDALSNIEIVDGSPHDDSITGDNLVNILSGYAGNDVINGMGGADTLDGGAGDDELNGGEGEDTLKGGPGGDKLDGGPGLDVAAYTTASVGVTVDMDDPSKNTGEAQGDTLINIEGLEGSDTQGDQLYGDSAGNVLRGMGGDDKIYGREGSDTCDGDSGDDRLEMGEGDDIGIGGPGADTIIGGPGTDTALYRGVGVIVDLSDYRNNANGEAEGDILAGVENIIGTDNDDELKGDAQANVIDGRGGDDIINGGGGRNVLVGGEGSDTFVVDFQAGGQFVLDDFTPGAGGETVVLRGFPDVSSYEDDVAPFLRAEFGDTYLEYEGVVIIFSSLLPGRFSAANFDLTQQEDTDQGYYYEPAPGDGDGDGYGDGYYGDGSGGDGQGDGSGGDGQGDGQDSTLTITFVLEDLPESLQGFCSALSEEFGITPSRLTCTVSGNRIIAVLESPSSAEMSRIRSWALDENAIGDFADSLGIVIEDVQLEERNDNDSGDGNQGSACGLQSFFHLLYV